MNFFDWFRSKKKSNEVPNYIENYLFENADIGQEIAHRYTKYNDWVVIRTCNEGQGFISIWMTTFFLKKPHKELLMSLHIEEDKTLKILDIKVLNEDRSKGYGTVFMHELFAIVKSNEIKKITGLAERPADPQLINFYKKFGIIIVNNKLHWESK